MMTRDQLLEAASHLWYLAAMTATHETIREKARELSELCGDEALARCLPSRVTRLTVSRLGRVLAWVSLDVTSDGDRAMADRAFVREVLQAAAQLAGCVEAEDGQWHAAPMDTRDWREVDKQGPPCLLSKLETALPGRLKVLGSAGEILVETVA